MKNKKIDLWEWGKFLIKYKNILTKCEYSQLVKISNLITKEIKRRKEGK